MQKEKFSYKVITQVNFGDEWLSAIDVAESINSLCNFNIREFTISGKGKGKEESLKNAIKRGKSEFEKFAKSDLVKR